ncbi:MAG: hypothetical protein H7Y59_16930 [Anaerolineales bacterium]|nr:hypothetical protein [Anaerolineales bacterium]
MNTTSLCRHIFLFLFIFLLSLISFACGAAAGTPPPSDSEALPTLSISLTESIAPPLIQPTQISVSPAIPETRRLTLEFPAKMRAGVEADIIILTLEVDDLGNITPTAQIDGNVVVGETVEIPDLYETHNVTAEARLDLAGMIIQPAQAVFEPLKRGQSVKFYWSIRPQETGLYRGTVWLHLNFSDKLSGEQSRIAISAQIIEIEAVDFFGLSVNVARTSGVIGSVVGGVIGFPFLENIIKFVFKKRKQKI